jgi:hypothetical protein
LLSTLFTEDTTFKYILPLSFMLCQDKVSVVRKSAANNIANLFMKMYKSGNELYKISVVENIRGFHTAKKFTRR